MTFVSKKNIHFTQTVTHTDIGKALGYLTPINIEDNTKQNKKYISLKVIFKRIGSKPLIANIMSQIVINKTISQIETYLQPFINGIYKLHIPSQFEIVSIEIIIQ